MPTVVDLPNGTQVEFPDGMDMATIDREIRKGFPDLAGTNAPSAAPAPQGEPGFLTKPLVNLPMWAYENQLLKATSPAMAEGLARASKGAVEGMTSPAGMAGVAGMFIAPEVAGPVIGAMALPGIKEGWNLMREGIKENNLEKITEGAASGGIAALTAVTGLASPKLIPKLRRSQAELDKIPPKIERTTDATQEGQVKEGVQPERAGTDAQRLPPETSAGDRLQPETPQLPEQPQAARPDDAAAKEAAAPLPRDVSAGRGFTGMLEPQKGEATVAARGLAGMLRPKPPTVTNPAKMGSGSFGKFTGAEEARGQEPAVSQPSVEDVRAQREFELRRMRQSTEWKDLRQKVAKETSEAGVLFDDPYLDTAADIRMQRILDDARSGKISAGKIESETLGAGGPIMQFNRPSHRDFPERLGRRDRPDRAVVVIGRIGRPDRAGMFYGREEAAGREAPVSEPGVADVQNQRALEQRRKEHSVEWNALREKYARWLTEQGLPVEKQLLDYYADERLADAILHAKHGFLNVGSTDVGGTMIRFDRSTSRERPGPPPTRQQRPNRQGMFLGKEEARGMPQEPSLPEKYDPRNKPDYAKETEKQAPSPVSAEQRQPAVREPKGQTETGTPQRSGEGQRQTEAKEAQLKALDYDVESARRLPDGRVVIGLYHHLMKEPGPRDYVITPISAGLKDEVRRAGGTMTLTMDELKARGLQLLPEEEWTVFRDVHRAMEAKLLGKDMAREVERQRLANAQARTEHEKNVDLAPVVQPLDNGAAIVQLPDGQFVYRDAQGYAVSGPLPTLEAAQRWTANAQAKLLRLAGEPIKQPSRVQPAPSAVLFSHASAAVNPETGQWTVGGVHGQLPKGTIKGMAVGPPEWVAPKEPTALTPEQVRQMGLEFYSREDINKADYSLQKAVTQRRAARQGPPSAQSLGIRPTLRPGRVLREFYEQDIAPAVKAGVDVAKAARKLFMKQLFPVEEAVFSWQKRGVDELFKGKGWAEMNVARTEAAFDDLFKHVSELPVPEQRQFFERARTGMAQPTPELQQAALLMRTGDQALQRAFNSARGLSPATGWLQHHAKLLWKKLPASLQASGTVPTWNDFLSDMAEGMRNGGVPMTTNPVDLFLIHTQDASKFIGLNRAWEGLKGTGSVTDVATGTPAPPYFVRLPGRIVNTYLPSSRAGAGRAKGEWYVQRDIANMINHYVSKDYIRENPVGRALMWMKNASTAIELGLSPFHAVFVSLETIGSSVGLGMTKMIRGGARRRSGMRDIATALWSPYTTAKLGGQVIRYFKDPASFRAADPASYDWFVKHYPRADELIRDGFDGGMQLKMNDDWRFRLSQSFTQAIKGDNPIGAALFHAIPSLNRMAMKPLFETYIPRLKVGMWLREYSFELQRNMDALSKGEITRPELARRTWAFIEDRFGEMNFDNLYWDRTFKSAMQFATRSVTWKLGNIRGFGKAMADTSQATGDIARFKWAHATLPMGWMIGMAVTTSVIASILSKVTTGKFPWDMAKDSDELLRNLAFPRISATDETQRLSVPTYLRDSVHLVRGPVSYIKSSMTGEISRAVDVWNNRDFYGTEVYHPDDPLEKKAWDVITHLIPMPFGLSSYEAAKRTGAAPGERLWGFAGLTKAPFYMSYSPGEAKALELMRARLPQGARTKEAFESSIKERQAAEAIKRGEMTPTEAVRQGLVKASRVQALRQRTQESLMLHAVRRLDADQSMMLYRAASKDEKNEIRARVREKVLNSRTLTPEKRRAYRTELME